MNKPFDSLNDTIAALASAPGSAARGILRVSGPCSWSTVAQTLVGEIPEIHPRRPQRYACAVGVDQGRLRLPVDVYVWPTRRSFTGEPLVEIHTIGSPPLLNEVLELLLTSGARPAERGEFTLRAFLAGRIDLVQAEAVLGVIDAANSDQLKTALDQLAGGISGKISNLREELLLHLADLEAGLDFVEEDIDFVQRPEFFARLNSAADFLDQLLQQSSDRMQSTGQYRVVLAGLPNAGKSTLFNALIDAEQAIVSPIAGTTRDYLAATIQDESGLRYELIDTAGWEDPRDGIEEAANAQRADQYQRADLILWCAAYDLDEESARVNEKLYQECLSRQRPVVKVGTKIDMGTSPEQTSVIHVSAQTKSGLSELRNAIRQALSSGADAELIGSTAARCRESLLHARNAVLAACSLVEQCAGDEIVALELRTVLDQLGRIVGAVYTDDILDRIFSRFCIGK